MSLRLRAVIAAALLAAFAGVSSASAGEFTDAAGRIVVIPDHINKVMAAGPTGAVLIYVLAPDKLAGWPRPIPRGSLPGRAGRLPTIGQLTGPNPTADAATVARIHPDLIIDSGKATPARAAFADQVMQATGVPFIIIDNGFDRIPMNFRIVGRVLGVAARGDDLAGSAEAAINAMRGRLLIQSATQRPRVYYARGRNGLETVTPGSSPGAAMEAAGAVNVSRFDTENENTITLEQLRQWNPDVIIVADRSFYQTIQRNAAWRTLTAVRNKKVYLEPTVPFGWIDDPPGINRLVGLYWLEELFYPGAALLDLRSEIVDFYDKFYSIKLSDAQVEVIAKTAGIPPSDTPHLSSLPSIGPLQSPGAPGAVNEPGRRGMLPNAPTAPPTTPSYEMPK